MSQKEFKLVNNKLRKFYFLHSYLPFGLAELESWFHFLLDALPWGST
jgi:hypothetical protein